MTPGLDGTALLAPLIAALHDGKVSLDDAISVLEEATDRIRAASAGADEDSSKPIGFFVRALLDRLDQMNERRGNGDVACFGIATGCKELDRKIGGWQVGIVSVVAGRPGSGKSSLLMATADACAEADIGCHAFSLEDSVDTYAMRSLSRRANVAAQNIREYRLNRDEMARLGPALSGLKRNKRWLLNGRGTLSADDVVREVRRHRKTNETRVVFVDYVTLLKSAKEARSPHEAITRSMQTLMAAAKDDDMAYVVVSQLNRGVEQRANKRPLLSDLRESGTLEEIAKCVVGVYRGAYYGDPTAGVDYAEGQPRPSDDEWKKRVELHVLKNANGETGEVHATWDGPTMTFR